MDDTRDLTKRFKSIAPLSVGTRTAKRRVVSASDLAPTAKRAQFIKNKDLYQGHSQDVILAKSLIDPEQKCSITTIKAYVTHVCAWFRYCRTLPEPNYKLVNEEKLSGFLKWATQTPRLPSKRNPRRSTDQTQERQRRWLHGGILALWRRFRKPDEENPLHALSYPEHQQSKVPRSQQERQHVAFAVTSEQEMSIVQRYFAMDPHVGVQAWAHYVLGASTWIPGNHRLHLRLSSLTASPESAQHVGRFAEIGVARHTNPLLCPWYAISLLIFMQWHAQPTASANASLADLGTWLGQALFQSYDQANGPVPASNINYTPDMHVVRARDKIMGEPLGMSATQVVRLAKWRIHHRREGVSRSQAFLDLALVISGQSPPQENNPDTYKPLARTKVPVPDQLVYGVFPWLQKFSSNLETRTRAMTMPDRPSPAGVRQSAKGAGKTEKLASLQVMREFARVLIQDTAALLIDPQWSELIQTHPLFSAPVFHSPVFSSSTPVPHPLQPVPNQQQPVQESTLEAFPSMPTDMQVLSAEPLLDLLPPTLPQPTTYQPRESSSITPTTSLPFFATSASQNNMQNASCPGFYAPSIDQLLLSDPSSAKTLNQDILNLVGYFANPDDNSSCGLAQPQDAPSMNKSVSMYALHTPSGPISPVPSAQQQHQQQQQSYLANIQSALTGLVGMSTQPSPIYNLGQQQQQQPQGFMMPMLSRSQTMQQDVSHTQSQQYL
ncbi:hypothetical protein DL89DRAFT_290313 [Linderina pennispora]|uniref:Ndc10 domain-containing protein n=1 Tax=Linderina pennispora TaxID=61395 RepID=A0A1Y1WNY7_9FUNG|nr:uncharacterized protein DL89DRAFT_290313 [Linderina pennispora]ORX74844.1 hypothetical protein DL89DRAFT_290313 [Linderina pennispora]